MKVRKYTARSSRDALRQVREDLGPDAVILANRMVRGGVELLAMPASEMAAHTAASEARTAALHEAAQPLEVTEDDVVGRPEPLLRPGRKPWSELGLEPDPLLDDAPRTLRRERESAPARRAVERDVAPKPRGVEWERDVAPKPRGVEWERDPAPMPRAIERTRAAAAFAAADPLFDTPDAPGFTPVVAPELRASRSTPIASAASSLLGLKPEPAPLAPPPAPVRSSLNLKPAPPALEPAVLRRRSPRRVEFSPTPALRMQASVAMPQDEASDRSEAGELAAMAASHDPLMAALAAEVQSLGSMLGQGTSSAWQAPAGAAAAAMLPRAVEAVESRARGQGGDDWVRNVMGELRSMRALLEDQMGAIAFSDGPRLSAVKARVVRILSTAGFSAPLIRRITAGLPDGIGEDEALRFVRAALANNLPVSGSEAAVLDEGGVFALVGPTGAGKTTTAAKLAARFVVRHGAENLALLTTDGYRIGGQEQLRIYGKILGVAVHAVKDAEDLRRTLAELRNRKLVLIDTVGLSQRDRMVCEQLQMFANCGVPVKRLLLLNATCNGDTLSDVVRAYRGDGLAGTIITKLDEAAAAGAALDTIIKERLRVFYVADGQRVPEDLHLADAAKLVEQALRERPEPLSITAGDGEFPLELPPVHLIGALGQTGGESGVAHG